MSCSCNRRWFTLNNPQQTAYAPSTANGVLAQLKTMGSYAVRWGILDTNEAAKIKLLRRTMPERVSYQLKR